jgi:hypothetical protein
MTAKRCGKGTPCGGTCIARGRKCKVELHPKAQTAMGKLRDYVKKHGAHTAEHVGKGVVAWKTGKVLGTAVSGYLESHYGIPREASQKMAETVIQAATMTALEAKHLKSVDAFAKKLIVEGAAAFLGKTAHGGVEHIMDAMEAKQILQIAAPTLAGKVTGIGTAIAGGKAPTPGALAKGITERAVADTRKLMDMFGRRQVAFAESTGGEAKVLADIAVAALMVAYG